jgi:hypothetical protein
MNPRLRAILIQSASFLATYITLCGALIYANERLGDWQVGIAWPAYWMIWVFAYWPLALAAPLAMWKLKPSPLASNLAHGGYIIAALIALQISLTIGSAWPMIIVKITGILVACFCITGLPRDTHQT